MAWLNIILYTCLNFHIPVVVFLRIVELNATNFGMKEQLNKEILEWPLAYIIVDKLYIAKQLYCDATITPLYF